MTSMENQVVDLSQAEIEEVDGGIVCGGLCVAGVIAGGLFVTGAVVGFLEARKENQ